MKIELKNVTKKFKENEVIKEVSITFEGGHIYGFYGRNGSGKSVLQKIISGLYVPTTGEVLLDGKDINKKNIFPMNMRVLIEKPAFFADLSGFKNLKVLADINKTIDDQKILDTLELVNLIKDKDKRYSKYSLGMKQKLGIAQVLMEDPDIMIFDEPFNGIENDTVKKITKYLLEQKDKGKLIIISTHIKEDLNKLSDQIYMFDDGKITKVKNV